jgi:prepilin-type N-terminal cleavage/methylation domain-containing protein/prepilin-type processing-associated H-X9-DG protein
VTRRPARPAGFSLVELLIVIGVMAVLVGIVLGAVHKVRAAAERAACQARLNQIGLAIHHHLATAGAFPRDGAPHYKSNLHWYVFLLPHFGEDARWQLASAACQQEMYTFEDPPHSLARQFLPVLQCPADWRLGETKASRVGPLVGLASYVATAPPRGQEGLLERRITTRPEDITDGLSNTTMATERPPPQSWDAGWWYSFWVRPEWYAGGVGPNGGVALQYDLAEDPTCRFCFGPGRIDNEADRYHAWSLHPGGGNFLFADGAVRFMSYSAAPRMPALASIAGGEAVSID